MMTKTKEKYNSFKDFYPFYLKEHAKKGNRITHFIGTSLALGFIVVGLINLNPYFLLFALLIGYFFAWVGHFFIEKNRPATFTYPLYSFLGDWVMFFELLTRKRKFSELDP